MSNIVIGSITLRHNPSKMTVVRPDKYCATKLTYSSADFFSWGTSIKGKAIYLEWTYMEADEFDDLDDLYKADAAVVFNPNDGLGKTYNVNITDLDSEYFLRELGVSAGMIRRNVRMTLQIMSEVA